MKVQVIYFHVFYPIDEAEDVSSTKKQKSEFFFFFKTSKAFYIQGGTYKLKL